ncbi:MAG: Calx-beta domain-containing protein, partial [Planctomycetaceae bacterium]
MEDSPTDLTGTNTAGALDLTSGGTTTLLSSFSLTASGVINGDVVVQNAATLDAGDGPGLLSVASLMMDAGSIFRADLDGTTAATQYDQVSVTGAITLAGALTLDPGFTAASGDSFTILNNQGAGAVSGTFTGLAEGDRIAVAGQLFQISYAGGDGNDVVLTAVVNQYDFDLANFDLAEMDSGNSQFITLNRNGDTSQASSVDVVIFAGVGDTATAGSDFTATTVTANFAAGASTASVAIGILGDTIVERDETLSLSLTNFSAGGQVGTTNPTASVTLTNDDTASITVADVSAAEGAGTLTFTLTLDHAISENVTVVVNTANIAGQAVAGIDYTAIVNQTVTFTAGGSLTETVNVTLLDDTLFEPNETFRLNLSNAQFGGTTDATLVTIGDPQAIGTILNDDTPILVQLDGGGNLNIT